MCDVIGKGLSDETGVKELWQMTREEYIMYNINKPMKGLPAANYTMEDIQRLLGSQHIEYETKNHFKEVQRAISEGKPVPSEVRLSAISVLL